MPESDPPEGSDVLPGLESLVKWSAIYQRISSSGEVSSIYDQCFQAEQQKRKDGGTEYTRRQSILDKDNKPEEPKETLDLDTKDRGS